jgi:hypothetical protein
VAFFVGKIMANEVGSRFIVESIQMQGSVDINKCIFCGLSICPNPYKQENNIYEYRCGLVIHVVYENYQTIVLGGQNVGTYDQFYTVLHMCGINFDTGDTLCSISSEIT